MKKYFIACIFVLVSCFGFGQKHEFLLQVMPHTGDFKNGEFEYEMFDFPMDTVTLINGETYTGTTHYGVWYTLTYSPLATFSFGMQSKSRLFYQVVCGAQLAKSNIKSYSGLYSGEGIVSDRSREIDLPRDTTGGAKNGYSISPLLALSLGYDFSERNSFLLQSSLWSYSISYQHNWELFSVGISCGRMFDAIANRIKIGPWLRMGSQDYDWLDKDSDYILSAYLNLNLSRMSGIKNVSSGTPKEF